MENDDSRCHKQGPAAALGLPGDVLSLLGLSPRACCGAQAGPQPPFLYLGGIVTTS